MITIDTEFATRKEAEDYAKEIEDAWPTEKFGTVLNIQKVARVPTTGLEVIELVDWYRVYGTREEKPK